MLSYCRDRLFIYDAAAPLDTHLINSFYGCSRDEPVVEILSSGSSMLVVWKQGVYSYYDPFVLTVKPLPIESCEHSIELKEGFQIQGQVRTPNYPSYYPPKSMCTWNFTVPSPKYGVVLRFEGYMLLKQYTYAPCTLGQWQISDWRMCGQHTLQSYAERIAPVSGSITLSFTCPRTLTGPGVQASYSLFNLSDPCPGEFLCLNNGLCVPHCDGVKDCPNNKDEENCVCPDQYHCPENNTCISMKSVCDGKKDCLNGTDEEQCNQAVACGPFNYKCRDGSCVKKPNPECDSVVDCPDGSDEKNCIYTVIVYLFFSQTWCSSSKQSIGWRHRGTRGEESGGGQLQVRGEHICGGTLVADRWILTAAHCFIPERFSSPEIWTVLLGKLRLSRSSKRELSFKVTQLVIHPFYNEESHDYDVALVLLDHSVPLTSPYVQPICLPASTHHFPDGSSCWITGWGAAQMNGLNSDELQKADVQLISQEICIALYRNQISPRMLCAGYSDGHKDACEGDSGSPLVCKDSSGRWFQVGVVSWGAGCGIPKYYGVYSRITRLVKWIQTVTS
ncbi:hypothetical protein GDO86_007399 [Hymenochirus boettgeri]|uniref:Transmembrane serine protease 6 n=1 Tax=Hymenochirus boettgeri TaxID=247094 RepID=A0A8T2J1N0_9PIPI|nr:hypothetical protein GDO86_007399 [Hymenochirus boettgeri]